MSRNPPLPGTDQPLPEPPCVTRLELAHLLSVSLSTINRMLAAGEIPFHRVRGRAIRFLRSDVETYLSQHRREQNSEDNH